MRLLINTSFRGLVFLVFIFVASRVNGQNLVLNPSFESVNLGNLQCSWYTSVAQFNSAINNWTLPTTGSTDIFHTSLSTTCYCSPFSTNASSPGQQAPRTGQSYVNIVTYGSGGCTPYREYVQGQLSTPLIAGQTYEVEMYVSLADNMTIGTNNIGVKFTTAPVNTGSMCVYNTVPDVNYTGPIIIDKTNWTQIIFCFTPSTSGLQYFSIGNFFNDANTQTLAAGGGSGTTIRYFVDDVRVELSSAAVDAGIDDVVDLCEGDTPINLFDELGGTPNQSGDWTGPSVLTGGYLGVFDPSVNVAGVYTYSVSSSGACSAASADEAEITVTISPSVDATINQAGPFCSSDAEVQLTSTEPGGVWAGNGITNASTGMFDPNVAGGGVHSISYTLTNGCTAVGTIDIVVNEFANADISSAGPFCLESGVQQLTAVSPGGLWSGDGITDVNTGVFDPSIAGVGNHIITYTISGSCGDSQIEEIEVLPMVDASINPAGPFCVLDNQIQLTSVTSGGTWSGNGVIDANSGMFDPSVAGEGTHIITYNLTGLCGGIEDVSIIVNEIISAAIDPVNPFCDGDAAVELTAANSGGTWSGDGIINTSSGLFDPGIAGIGSHTISYTTIGACGETQIIDIDVLPVENATIIPAGPFCVDAGIIQLASVNSGGIWSGPGITDATSGEFNPALAGIGTHTITYSISGPCPDSKDIELTVNDIPQVSFTVNSNEGCVPMTVTFTSNQPSGTTNCQWSFGDGGESDDCGTTSHTYITTGCFDVGLTIIATGCTNSSSISDMVCVNDAVVAGFISEEIESETSEEWNFQFTSTSSNANFYEWSFGDGNSSIDENPLHVYSNVNNAMYEVCLIASNAIGCNDTYCESIQIIEDILIEVPNVFSPNGDDVNDYFQLVEFKGVDQFNIVIFNRWGNFLREFNEADFKWDGSDSTGSEMTEGVYFYKLKAVSTLGEEIEQHGFVHLVRK